ncbi:MAG: hypothetical protein JXN64_02205 [Spirochaetes bacterium]|nr:hypothetical protein [Spirochaetota bacterium]
MKIPIVFLIFIFIVGCSASSMPIREDHISNGVRPLMENQPEEKKINISVPVYNF